MTIYDLEFGDIVITRDNKKWLYVYNDIICKETNRHISVIYFEDDLKNVLGRDLDIMKVQRYNKYQLFDCDVSDNLYQLEIIYERKEEILDEKEKEYLKAVIKPFKDRVLCIKKGKITPSDEFINIYML